MITLGLFFLGGCIAAVFIVRFFVSFCDLLG